MDIEKLADEFEALTEPKHNMFEGTDLRNEAKKLELLAGKLFYLSKKESTNPKAIEHAAKLILAAADTLSKI
jgi:hypothetical protein